MLPQPANLPERYQFIADLCGGVLLTSRELADRWRLSVGALANARAQGTSAIPWINLTSGSVRYRLSEVLWWEISHTNGTLTPERLAQLLATMPDVPPALAARIVERARSP